MDIMEPPLERQADPAPWLSNRRKLDVRAAVARILEDNPRATPDDVVRELAARHVQVNGGLVAQEILEVRRQRAESALPAVELAAGLPAAPAGSAVGAG